jgi:hypothetical protein
MSPFFKLSAIATLALSLGACQTLFAPNLNKPLQVKRDAWEHTKPGCAGADCPLVNIDTVHFADEPQLDMMVQRHLLELTRNTPQAPAALSLKDYEAQYLATAKNRNASYLQAKVREQHDGLVIIELSSYLDDGGPQGTPGRGFINYSRAQHKALSLDDMLLPGQEEAFWKTAELAHKSWQLTTKGANDPQFVKDWPFQKTPYIALTYGAVVLKYQVSTIAPYAMGHIELRIPYPRLNGVIRPELFPGRG